MSTAASRARAAEARARLQARAKADQPLARRQATRSVLASGTTDPAMAAGVLVAQAGLAAALDQFTAALDSGATVDVRALYDAAVTAHDSLNQALAPRPSAATTEADAIYARAWPAEN